MKARRGEVVIIDFPYTDQTGSKIRPALVVQSDRWNRVLDDTILAPITSSPQRKVGAPTQYFIDVATVEGQQTGLSLNSVVQCGKLITFDQRLILRVIGSLSDAAMRQIDVCLKTALDIG